MKKEERKQMKGPDALQERFLLMADWCQQNQKALIIASIALIMVVLAGVAGNYYVGHKRLQRQVALSGIDMIYDQEETDFGVTREKFSEELRALSFKVTEAQQKLTDHKANSKKKKGKAKAAAELQAALKQAQDELRAKQAQLAKLKPEHPKSAMEYAAFAKKHEGTVEALRANLTYTQILLDQEKFEKAEAILADILKRSGEIAFYKFQVRSLYVSVLEQLGRFDKAKEQADLLVAMSSEKMKPKMLLVQARVVLASGKVAEGKKILQQILEKHGQSAEAQRARAIKAAW